MVLESLAVGGIIGIASSFVASKVFLFYTNAKLPIIDISDYIVVDENKEQLYLVLKILNKTIHPILDTDISLYGVNYQNVDHSISNLELISSKSIHSIREYSPLNKERPDAIWAGLKITREQIEELKTFENLRIEITTRESFYNTFLSIDKTYTYKDIQENHIFEKGDDMTCRKVSK